MSGFWSQKMLSQLLSPATYSLCYLPLSSPHFLIKGKIIVLMSKDCWEIRKALMKIKHLTQSLAHNERDSTLALILLTCISFWLIQSYAVLFVRSNYCRESSFLVFWSRSCFFLPSPGRGVVIKAFMLNYNLSLSVREGKRGSGNSNIFL